jgi:hypothetical protein
MCGEQVAPARVLVDAQCPGVIECEHVPVSGTNEELLRWAMRCGEANKSMREAEQK